MSYSGDPDIRALLERAGCDALDCATIATSPDGTVVYWDEHAAELYGWPPEEAVGRNIIDLTPARQSVGAANRIMGRLRRGQSWDGEMVLRRRGGDLVRAYVMDFPVGDLASDDGVILGFSVQAGQGAQLRRHQAQIGLALTTAAR